MGQAFQDDLVLVYDVRIVEEEAPADDIESIDVVNYVRLVSDLESKGTLLEDDTAQPKQP